MKTRTQILAAGVATLALTAGTAFAQMEARTDPPPAPSDKQTVGEYTADAVITTKVKAALLADSSVSGLDVKVETTDGVVVLQGDVVDAGQIAAAERIAQQTEGVKSVTNQLVVKAVK